MFMMFNLHERNKISDNVGGKMMLFRVRLGKLWLLELWPCLLESYKLKLQNHVWKGCDISL